MFPPPLDAGQGSQRPDPNAGLGDMFPPSLNVGQTSQPEQRNENPGLIDMGARETAIDEALMDALNRSSFPEDDDEHYETPNPDPRDAAADGFGGDSRNRGSGNHG
jgi:hypothetical protein